MSKWFSKLSLLASIGAVAVATQLPPAQLVAPVQATRLPAEIEKTSLIQQGGKTRLDGGIETSDGRLFLLLLPADKEGKRGKFEVDTAFPNSEKPDVVLYTNGWAHIRVQKHGNASFVHLKEAPDKLRKKLLSMRFASDLIAPQGFVLPKSMKALVQDLPSISLVDDEVIDQPDFGLQHKKKSTPVSQYRGHGSIFLTSITSGSITMIDGRTFTKLAEFPTEGTPLCMDLANSLLYIADEAKHRILVLDPIKRKFAGQIDLVPHAAPKGISSQLNGNWIYVSESGINDVAVIETATSKLLMRIKVKPGPGRLALTPDGGTLLVLNVTSGEVTFISTSSQRVIGVLRVGDMPTSILIARDGKTAYIANRISSNVSVVNIPSRQVVATLKCGPSPTSVLVSGDDKKLLVATGRDNMITEYDCATLAKVRELRVPQEMEFPGSLCLLPDGKHFIAISQGGDSLAEIDCNTLEISSRVTLGHANNEALWAPIP